MKHLILLALVLAVPGAAWADTNIAPDGTVIMGYTTAGDDSVYGTNYRGNGGPLSNLNDGITSAGNSVDEWGQPGGSNNSDAFIGIMFSSPVTSLQLNSVDFYGSIFGDGGWWGKQATAADGSSGDFATTLISSVLVVPTLQYTTDNGVTWNDLTNSNDYVTQYTGVKAPNGGNIAMPEVVFTADFPVSDFDGIRLIGPNGGFANGGFIAATQIELQAGAVPEPSTYAMMLGGLALLGFCVRRKTALVS
jgi:hypothetical protein